MRYSSDVQTVFSDPTLAEFELSRSAVFYPLGFPVQINTNSRDVIAAAHESWPEFVPRSYEAPLRVSLAVSDPVTPLPRQPVYRSRNHLLTIISDTENFI